MEKHINYLYEIRANKNYRILKSKIYVSCVIVQFKSYLYLHCMYKSTRQINNKINEILLKPCTLGRKDITKYIIHIECKLLFV